MEYDHPFTYNLLRTQEQLKKTKIILSELGNHRTLDVGCGTGISSCLFSDIMGIDPSEPLLSENPYPHIKGIAEELPFKNEEFEQVISITAIHNFNNIEKGLKEIKRVGKKYGLSVLKRSAKFDEIKQLINKHFTIKKEIDEGIDVIFICE